MNTFMNTTTMELVNAAIDKFNHQVRLEVCPSIFSKRFETAERILNEKCDSILSDVWATEHLGYISHDEAVGIHGDIQRMTHDAIMAVKDAEHERLGEREYTINWLVWNNGYTIEEATKEYEEEWV